MRLVFFGSSQFSLPALETCLECAESVRIITTPAKPQGRGLTLLPNPIQSFAESQKIDWLAPETLRGDDPLNEIRNWKPNVFVVSSYGKMIPAAWLSIPSQARFNVHPSLLPKYRGAAPINWPILNGDLETGLSIAEITKDLDAGDIHYQKEIKIGDSITATELEKELSKMSRDALRTVFQQLKSGSLSRTPQNHSVFTYARKLEKKDGMIDWSQPAKQISSKVRGLLPWPVASFTFQNHPLQILDAEIGPTKGAGTKPGTVLAVHKEMGALEVQTGDGSILIKRVKPAGKKEMSALDFANGARLQPGFLL